MSKLQITFCCAFMSGIAKSYNFFGSGRGPILLENVQCSGLESSVLDCESDGLGITSCSHFEDAGVICEGWQLFCLIYD